MDPDPEITLSEMEGVRYLHFGSPWVQGAMRMDAPNTLVLDYLERMMAWLLFLRTPVRVLQLGLGAGSLVRYCHRHLPDCTVTAVERSEAVIDCARRWFGLPAQRGRFRLVRADAADFVADPAHRGAFDVVQVDLYDAEARGPVLDTEAFYADCRRCIDGNGMIVVNLFGAERLYASSRRNLMAALGGRMLTIASGRGGNVIALGFVGAPLTATSRQLEQRARIVSKHFGLNTGEWLDQLRQADVLRPAVDPRSLLLRI